MSGLVVGTTPLAGLRLVERRRSSDERGSLARIFCRDTLAAAGWTRPIVQVNHSCTTAAGTVRGLHWQRAPHADTRLVSCIRGEVWDVAVDLRTGSPTFLQWHAERLSALNGRALLIPEGFAHGFQALTDDVELIYCHAAAYVPAAEAGLHPLEPRLAIAWPRPVTMLSARDAGHAFVDDGFEGEAP